MGAWAEVEAREKADTARTAAEASGKDNIEAVVRSTERA